MQTLPDEPLEMAIIREGNTAGFAFARRMMDVGASPVEGQAVLAALLVLVCAQCCEGDMESAHAMLALIVELAHEGQGPACAYIQALLAEEASIG